MAYDNELSGQVIVDIETCAMPDAGVYLDPAEAPGNYKDEAKIAAYIADKQQKQIAEAGLEPDLCEIVAVGFLADDLDLSRVYTRADTDERGLIILLLNAIGNRSVVGFRSLSFDLPVVIRRAQYLGIPCPDFSLDRYRSPHLDIAERLSFNGKITWRSLSFYCRSFGIPHDDTVKGKDITGLVAAHDWEAVAAHCRSDVEATAALARRLGWVRPVSAQAVA